MKQTLQIIGLSFIVVSLALGMVALIVIGNTLPSQRVYDCSMAEFHPDFPIAEAKEYYLSETVLRKEGILYICRIIEEAQVIEETHE